MLHRSCCHLARETLSTKTPPVPAFLFPPSPLVGIAMNHPLRDFTFFGAPLITTHAFSVLFQDMEDMYSEAAEKGAAFLEAPVSGSKVRW